jgi:formylglycine-generating enzyme required for sulfatase activity
MTGKRVGLVIGNNYPNSNKELRFAVADALKMKEVLLNKDICGFDYVEDSIDSTFLDARIKIERVLKKANHGDLIFIYFSGHGKKDFENDLCLLFNDTEEDALLATSLTFDFINKCRKYPSQKSVIIVLDCCYSGAAGIRDTDVMEALKRYSGSGTIILTSTGLMGSPAAREEDKFGHGVFTHYLIEGLEKGYADKGNGYISIEELYDYAFEMTKSDGYQSPKMEGSIEGSIFIGRNPLKIRENEYELKKSKLLTEFGTQLHPRILNESLTILKNNYQNLSSMEQVDINIHYFLESLLKGEFSVDNYSEAVQYLKGISTKTPIFQGVSSQNVLKPDVLNISYAGIREFSRYSDIPKTFTSSSTGMEFVLIPAGKFMMGSPSDEKDRYDKEGPAHEVTIKNPFYLGKYPVTQKQWENIMGSNPSRFKGDYLSVENVSWEDVHKFIKKLAEIEGTDKYRLLSEAEWEYACRAGTTTRFCFGDNESELGNYGWYNENSGSKTHPVGQKQPNPFGLYDMHGNVWEWVQDRWHDNYKGAPSDGSAWEDGDSSDRVLRGGCWYHFARDCRSAFRDGNDPGDSDFSIGFRLLRKM